MAGDTSPGRVDRPDNVDTLRPSSETRSLPRVHARIREALSCGSVSRLGVQKTNAAISLFQVPLRIHTSMQHPDDMNSSGRHGVIDGVTAYEQHTVPFAHVV